MFCRTVLVLGAVMLLVQPAPSQDIFNYEDAPIHYSNGTPDNPVSRLQERMSKGRVKLRWGARFGYLADVLKELDVPATSQALTFAKTSLQSGHIGPSSPRAIYFNDETYVGFVTSADISNTVLELAVADRSLGVTFYTLDQTEAVSPRFTRQTNRCLNCHGDLRTRGVPGLLVRSVYPDPEGRPVIAAGSFRTDHASPLKQRWGGWYVSGTHGTDNHLGNFALPNARKPKTIDNAAGQNVIDLTKRFDAGKYLSQHSDIVALLVLEHQIDAINYITRLRFEALALKPGGDDKPFADAVDRLVGQLLFAGEMKLTQPVKGTTEFARDFEKPGPADKKGRSLRQLDLATRLFKYPCSHVIYSDAFASLPENARAAVYQRLWLALTAKVPEPRFAHLSEADRLAIREILTATKADIPDYWR